MSSNDYLWDPESSPDDDVVELEDALAPLRHAGRAPDFSRVVVPADTTRSRWGRFPLLALGLAAAAAVALFLQREPDPAVPSGRDGAVVGPATSAVVVEPRGWVVDVVGGAPTCDGEVMDRGARLVPGTWLETNADARAALRVPTTEEEGTAEWGTTEVGPATRLRILDASGSHQPRSRRRSGHRLEVTRGHVVVMLNAPAEAFVIVTPFAEVVDLGCRYDLRVADDHLELDVTSGEVALRRDGAEVRVPAGATAEARAGALGLPRARDTSDAFEAALERWAAESPDGEVDTALDELLASAEGRDAITLHHLAQRLGASDRRRVLDRLFALGAPAARRAALETGDRDAFEALWPAVKALRSSGTSAEEPTWGADPADLWSPHRER
ncbi:MAG: hypothetical protein R3B72_09695 [Polyangiaceae bacterium]